MQEKIIKILRNHGAMLQISKKTDYKYEIKYEMSVFFIVNSAEWYVDEEVRNEVERMITNENLTAEKIWKLFVQRSLVNMDPNYEDLTYKNRAGILIGREHYIIG